VVTRVQSVLYRVVPAVLILGLAAYTAFGPTGLVEERRLAHDAEKARQAWLDVEKRVDLKMFEDLRLGRDAVEVERLAADELGLARPGAKLYEFEGDELAEGR
jgi:hypothetical protein